MDKLQWIPKYDKNWDPVLECPACGYWRAGYDTTNLFLPQYCERCGVELDNMFLAGSKVQEV
jgi:hypothetical protein